jgi:hypothetical protein
MNALLKRHSDGVPPDAKKELLELANTYDLRIKGIVRGRDVTRSLVSERNATISELQGRIRSLEMEREGLLKMRSERGQQ